jgi:hypothetical protein
VRKQYSQRGNETWRVLNRLRKSQTLRIQNTESLVIRLTQQSASSPYTKSLTFVLLSISPPTHPCSSHHPPVHLPHTPRTHLHLRTSASRRRSTRIPLLFQKARKVGGRVKSRNAYMWGRQAAYDTPWSPFAGSILHFSGGWCALV